MWQAFEADKTKRAFSSVIRLRRQLYTSTFTVGGNMERWLDNVESIRRQLENMHEMIPDQEMVNIILQGVEETHRNVVRIFNQQRPVGQPITLDIVLYALRGEAETDKAHQESKDDPAGGGATKVMSVQKQPYQQRQFGKKWKRGSGDPPSSNKKTKTGDKKCWFCKTKGHLRHECYGYLAQQKKKGEDSSASFSASSDGGSMKMVQIVNGHPVERIGMVTEVMNTVAMPMSFGPWMMDSGAATHVCTEERAFMSFEQDDTHFQDWEGGISMGKPFGKVMIRAKVGNNESNAGPLVELRHTRYAPNGTTNILCQYKLEQDGWVPFYTDEADPNKRSMILTKDGVRLLLARRGAHFWLTAQIVDPVEAKLCMVLPLTKEDMIPRWHMRFAHLNGPALKKMAELHMVDRLTRVAASDFNKRIDCHACHLAKQKRMAYRRQPGKRQQDIGARLMSDVCYVGIETPGGAKYFQLVHDETSRFTWVFLLQLKSQASANVMQVVRKVEKHYPVRTFSCDQGGEFVNTVLSNFLHDRGIEFLTTNAYIPEENCLVEKMNGKLMAKVRATHEASGLPFCLSGEILMYVVTVDNMSGTKALKNKTPYEMYEGKKPDLQRRSRPVLMLGFSLYTNEFRMLDLETETQLRTILPQLRGGGDLEEKDSALDISEDVKVGANSDDSLDEDDDVEMEEAGFSGSTGVITGGNGAHTEQHADAATTGSGVSNISQPAGPTTASPARRIDNRQRRPVPAPTRRSTRQRRPNSRYSPHTFVMAITLMQCMLVGVVNEILNPTSVREAMASPQAAGWKEAMDKEYDSQMRNGTWVLVPRPTSTKANPINILKCLWVLVAKRNEKGVVERLKARLAVKGFMQKYGIDYLATYSPVVRIESVRLVMILALMFCLDLRHIDIVTAFLNGVLTGVNIYMEQPEEYDDGTGRVCMLLKCLYGLKQASKIWSDTLKTFLLELGFKQCAFDVGVFWRMGGKAVVFLTVYVDDIVIAAKSDDYKIVIKQLAAKFEVKDLGRVKHLLGMEVSYEPGHMITMVQTAYIERMAQRFGLADARPAPSPQMHHEPTTPVEKAMAMINDPKLPYREIVGSLQYLVACTRPDLANAVRTLGRYANAYTRENYRAAQRVVRYALATKDDGLVYRAQDGPLQMEAFADADHARCPETSKSVTGFVIKLNGCAFDWRSKKQDNVTTHTCSSELFAVYACAEVVLWAQDLLKELGVKQTIETTLFCDNQSTLKAIEINGNSDRLRNYAKVIRYVADHVDAGKLQLLYVPTTDNLADIFTKALEPTRFKELRDGLSVENAKAAWIALPKGVQGLGTKDVDNMDIDMEMASL
ncbi:Retrovirus-related Pol polyprotein from transposon TNT 1-94 [Phytophthora rubi]|uniref:Retrovirus-related Pol polyprotein from transposon TNT 1-94 n=1 Tax=Phytophthora rubi TaxID=129364 RepID=A0A6A3MM71_9STRA|nr:Retrovirus-related Pol polyprotein from transposon TNT 1-94 [Phytophthora rubi]